MELYLGIGIIAYWLKKGQRQGELYNTSNYLSLVAHILKGLIRTLAEIAILLIYTSSLEPISTTVHLSTLLDVELMPAHRARIMPIIQPKPNTLFIENVPARKFDWSFEFLGLDISGTCFGVGILLKADAAGFVLLRDWYLWKSVDECGNVFWIRAVGRCKDRIHDHHYVGFLKEGKVKDPPF